MNKADFIKTLEKYNDIDKIAIKSSTKFDGYLVLSEDIEVVEDEVYGEKVLIIKEKNENNEISKA